ncbi:MAG TPA: signal peptidase I, partial [Lacipirellulaceae bacterium]|nr:signal peptidase I [Lacipirellulaceae bacterium]
NETERRDLLARTDALRQARRERADVGKLKLLIEALEGTLRRTGGRIYPKTALVENVEFFLVAAIVILGVRTYFVQPFKIPTNSMWPSYYGMTPVVYPTPAEQPGTAQKIFRFLAFGAKNYHLIAPESGEISADFLDSGALAYTEVPGRRWLVLPATFHEYTLLVNGTPVKFKVPEDFHVDEVMKEAFFGNSDEALFAQFQKSMPTSEVHMIRIRPGSDLYRVHRLPLGRTVGKGDTLLSFDLLTGDQLFVDRISYHFMRPKVGQGFVFRTGNIPGIAINAGDQYYIKRLIGLPGDTLQIKEPMIWRNGSPIQGAAAFEKNAHREGLYRGYFNGNPGNGARLLLTPDEKLTVPERSFFALGDNSGNSADGRYWGFVPAKDVVGRPLFIYYPFTRRWGPAR